MKEKIGDGVYGEVFRAHDTQSGLFVAIKRPLIPKSYAEEGLSVSMIREAALLTSFRGNQHENVLKLQDCFVFHSRIYLVFELWHCNLRNHIADVYASGADTMDAMCVKSYMRQMLSALEYCHERRVIHRDMKPDNILLDESRKHLVICDFGMARTFVAGNQYTDDVVSVWYRPPEILLGDLNYGTAVDMWSAGMILAEMINLSPVLASCESEIECLCYLFEYLGTPNEESWPGITQLPNYDFSFKQWLFGSASSFLEIDHVCPLAIDLLDQLLQLCPKRRLTASEALRQHAYFLPDINSEITADDEGCDSNSQCSADSSEGLSSNSEKVSDALSNFPYEAGIFDSPRAAYHENAADDTVFQEDQDLGKIQADHHPESLGLGVAAEFVSARPTPVRNGSFSSEQAKRFHHELDDDELVERDQAVLSRDDSSMPQNQYPEAVQNLNRKRKRTELVHSRLSRRDVTSAFFD